MSVFFLNYFKYTAILLGVPAGGLLISSSLSRAGIRGFLKKAGFSLLFSATGVLSVMIFAAMESLLSGKRPEPGAVSVCGVYLVSPLFLWGISAVMKKRPGEVFDLYALYVLPTLFLMRINCLITGCCRGIFLFGSAFRAPVREAEMLFYAGMLTAFLYRGREKKERKNRDMHRKPEGVGRRFPVLMLSYGIFRFLIEFFRESSFPGVLHLTHLWAVLIMIFGFAALFEINHGKAIHKSSRKGGHRK